MPQEILVVEDEPAVAEMIKFGDEYIGHSTEPLFSETIEKYLE